MFAVIYRFKLQASQEENYKQCWQKIAHYFKENCGALGSCLHKGENGLWVAYSRWPDKATRDAAWPGKTLSSKDEIPLEIREAMHKMQEIKVANQDLEQYDEICLEVVADLLLPQ